MAEERKFTVTTEQGQVLFRVAGGFALPEKLGDLKYDVAERAVASDEVRDLFRELKSRSPNYSISRRVQFGPAEGWDEVTIPDGSGSTMKAWTLKPEQRETPVEIKLSEDALSGVAWCLLVTLHPASPMRMGVQDLEDIIWPLAKVFGLVGMLRKDLGVDKTKHRRIELDKEEKA